MDRTGDIVWSFNGEDYTYDTKQEMIESAYFYDHVNSKWVGPQVGDKVYSGKIVMAQVRQLVDADDIIEMLNERAYDNFGEYAESWPDLSMNDIKDKKAVELLNKYLKNWVKKYCPVNFYNIVEVEEHILSEEDIKEENK